MPLQRQRSRFIYVMGLVQAYWEAEQDAAEREREKKYERVMKRWVRLVQGLRIRQRLQAQYASDMPKEVTISVPIEVQVSLARTICASILIMAIYRNPHKEAF
jgi:hypothetical protein